MPRYRLKPYSRSTPSGYSNSVYHVVACADVAACRVCTLYGNREHIAVYVAERNMPCAAWP